MVCQLCKSWLTLDLRELVYIQFDISLAAFLTEALKAASAT